MIWVLSESPPSVMHCAVFVAAEMIFVLGGLRVPERAWPFFLVSNGVFNLLGNISQLWLNFKQRSCGQVSAITLLLSLSGNTVRIFTSMVLAQGDSSLLGLFLVSWSLNVLRLVQLIMYR
mmetsp:Transcript_64974/g.146587  ORF Transcript_64974/g.146587 Transcript_64974/m.146587 type:complete len:120 (+) Transcript_64974:458-817(+)